MLHRVAVLDPDMIDWKRRKQTCTVKEEIADARIERHTDEALKDAGHANHIRCCSPLSQRCNAVANTAAGT